MSITAIVVRGVRGLGIAAAGIAAITGMGLALIWAVTVPTEPHQLVLSNGSSEPVAFTVQVPSRQMQTVVIPSGRCVAVRFEEGEGAVEVSVDRRTEQLGYYTAPWPSFRWSKRHVEPPLCADHQLAEVGCGEVARCGWVELR